MLFDLKLQFFKKLDKKAKNIADIYCKGKPITSKVLLTII